MTMYFRSTRTKNVICLLIAAAMLLLVACVPTTAAPPPAIIIYPTLNADQLTAWAPATLMAAKSAELVAQANGTAPTPMPTTVTTQTVEVVGQYTNTVEQWRPEIDEWSVVYGVDADIIATVLQVQTCGNKDYFSERELRYGLFGVEWFLFSEGDDHYDLNRNAELGMEVLRDLSQQTNSEGLVFGGWKSRAAMVQSFDRWPRLAMQFFWSARPIYVGAKAGDGGAAAREWLASLEGQYVCAGVKVYQR
jgi:hypothetical protein